MLALLLALSLPQEPAVELHTTLAAPIRAVLSEQLAPLGEIRWVEHPPYDLLAALRARSVRGLVVGLEGALLCANAAALEPRRGIAPDLLAPCRDPQDRFVVPWLLPVASVHTDEAPPADHDELLHDRSFEGRIAVCGPEVMPGLWIVWMQRQLRQGASLEHGFAWWRTLDARVDRYCATEEEALTRVAAQAARVALVTVPAALAELPSRQLRIHAPPGGMPVCGLGIAATTGAPERALRMLDRLASAGVAVELGRRGLALPAPRQGLPREQLAPALRELYPGLMPYDPLAPDAAAWLERFERDVRGQGSRTVWLEDLLDLIFGVLFLAALGFLYFRMRKQP